MAGGATGAGAGALVVQEPHPGMHWKAGSSEPWMQPETTDEVWEGAQVPSKRQKQWCELWLQSQIEQLEWPAAEQVSMHSVCDLTFPTKWSWLGTSLHVVSVHLQPAKFPQAFAVTILHESPDADAASAKIPANSRSFIALPGTHAHTQKNKK